MKKLFMTLLATLTCTLAGAQSKPMMLGENHAMLRLEQGTKYVLLPVEEKAENANVRIIGSEIVGLTPAKALIDCAEFYLKIENFNCKNQIMEYHLIDME